MNIGFAMCGSFCTYASVFPVMTALAREHNVIPILSEAAATVDSRFGTAQEHLRLAGEICGTKPILTLEQAEPIGPKKLLDVLLIAPCTGNTLAKLAHSIADGPVTMAAKSHLRNGRPVVIALSTNDALAGAAENIGKLLGKKNYYFVPFGQDNALQKPCSLIADFRMLPETVDTVNSSQAIAIPPHDLSYIVAQNSKYGNCYF